MQCVCAECGHEQERYDELCQKCHSVRVITQKFAEETFGPHWRKAFLPRDHPDALKQEDLPPGRKLID